MHSSRPASGLSGRLLHSLWAGARSPHLAGPLGQGRLPCDSKGARGAEACMSTGVWLTDGVSETPYRGAQGPRVPGHSGASHPGAPPPASEERPRSREVRLLGSVVLAVTLQD